MADSVAVDDSDRTFEIEPVGLNEDAVQKRQHLAVQIRSPSEKDDTRAGGITAQDQPRIVEISRDDDSTVTPGSFDDLVIGRLGKSDRGGMNRVVAGRPQVGNCVGGHRHVNEKPHPVSSIVSSSARLAAYRRASAMSASSR